jgi:redox-sensing transcriptional repressor
MVTLSLPVLRRLPAYLRFVQGLKDRGEGWVSSSDLAAHLGFTAIQVRKDLACTGIVGSPRRGFPVGQLIKAIDTVLGGSNLTDVFLVGTGERARVVQDDPSLGRHGFAIVATFDKDPPEGSPAFPLLRIGPLAHRMGVKLAILAVDDGAQDAADQLVEAGFRGVWNCTGVAVTVPPSVAVIDEDRGAHLTHLAGQVRQLPAD